MLGELQAEIIACRACPRLVDWREEVARTKRRAYNDWEYWGKPIPGWGDPAARLILVGLAPGAHGSNRTGRPFTGDGSGSFLFAALHRAGFASRPISLHRDDGLCLVDCYITAIGRCAPPQNKPTSAELDNCRPFLARELTLLPNAQILFCLGHLAFEGTLRVLREAGAGVPRHKFAHGTLYEIGEGWPSVLACYHPSQQNTNTGVLTSAMMDAVLAQAKARLHPV